MADGRFIYRFTRDLRLDDHAGLAAAASYGAIVPLLVVDTALEGRLKCSPRRAAFFCAAVDALDAELREHGSRLLIRRGEAGAAIANLAAKTGASGVAWSIGYGGAELAADQRLQSELEESGLRAVAVHDAPAVTPEDTAARSASGEGYRAFAPFFEAWNEVQIASHEHPLLVRFEAGIGDLAERLPNSDDFGSSDAHRDSPEIPRDAGSRAARKRLEEFLQQGALRYAPAASVPSEAGTSHLSVPLSFGTLSARTAVAAARRRVEDPLLASEERISLRWFLRSLARRDFFLQLAWFYPHTQEQPLQDKMRGFSFAPSHPNLDAWLAGKTGFPIVDAGMRQLRATGWMHPYVRAIAASFLCFDLGVDWRVGRECWDRWLVEDDPVLATGNWQWIAAVGADMAAFPRIYNPERQRRRCDPDGSYVRRWVEELTTVPTAQWPHRRGNSPQLALDLAAPSGYPRPILDHERAARAFLARYRAFASA